MTEIVVEKLNRLANLLAHKAVAEKENLITRLTELVTLSENLIIAIWDCKREGSYNIQLPKQILSLTS